MGRSEIYIDNRGRTSHRPVLDDVPELPYRQAEAAVEYAKILLDRATAPPPRPSRIAALARSAWESWLRGTLFVAFLFLVALPVAALATIEVYRAWAWVFHGLGISCAGGGCL